MESMSKPGGRASPISSSRASVLARARAAPRRLVFLLLLCFVLQGTVVQSHVHLVRAASSLAAASGAAHIEGAPSDSGDSAADCPLCQEAAVAGAYVLPAVAALPPPPEPMLWAASAAHAGFALAAPSVGWQSRAPPE